MSILQESLTEKRQVLLEIQEYNRKQEAVFTAEEVDMSLFDEAIEEKGRLVQKLTQLDEGFEAMYEKLAKELEHNRDKYAGQIRVLKQQIKEITDLGVSIQAQEARNKSLIESYFSRERSNMSSLSAAGNQSSYDSKQ